MSSDTQFKPGQTGNAGGRPALPSDIKDARKNNRIELERIAGDFLFRLEAKEIEAQVKRPGVKQIEVILAAMVQEVRKKPDDKKLLTLLGCAGIVIKQHLSLDGGEDDDGTVRPLQIARVDLLDRIKQLEEAKIKQLEGAKNVAP